MLKARLLLALMFLGAGMPGRVCPAGRIVIFGKNRRTHRAPVAGATVQLEVENHTLLLVTGEGGDFQISNTIHQDRRRCCSNSGYAPQTERLFPNQPRTITLALATNSQRVVVTADRTALALNESADTVRVAFAAGDAADR